MGERFSWGFLGGSLLPQEPVLSLASSHCYKHVPCVALEPSSVYPSFLALPQMIWVFALDDSSFMSDTAVRVCPHCRNLNGISEEQNENFEMKQRALASLA